MEQHRQTLNRQKDKDEKESTYDHTALAMMSYHFVLIFDENVQNEMKIGAKMTDNG